jgi:hypothetical protein
MGIVMASRLFRTCLLTGLLALQSWPHSAALADSSPDPLFARLSSLWIDGGFDSTDSRSGHASLDLAIGEASRVRLGAGTDVIALGGDDLDARSVRAGLTLGGLGNFDVGADYSYWGDPSEIVNQTGRLTVKAHLGDWDLAVTPEYRQYQMYTRPILGIRREVEFESTGWGAALDYWPSDRWHFRLNGSAYAYSKDVTRLDTVRAQRVFSSKAFTLAAGLLDRYLNAEFGYHGDVLGLTLYHTRTVSAIDLSNVNFSGAVLTFYISRSVTVELEGGVGNSDRYADTSYGNLAMGLHW